MGKQIILRIIAAVIILNFFSSAMAYYYNNWQPTGYYPPGRVIMPYSNAYTVPGGVYGSWNTPYGGVYGSWNTPAGGGVYSSWNQKQVWGEPQVIIINGNRGRVPNGDNH